MIAYLDYPASVFESGRTLPQLLEAASAGAVKNIEGHLEQQKHSTLQGYPRVTNTGAGKGIHFRSAIVMVRPRMYMLIFISADKAELTHSDAQKCFESFGIWPTGASGN